jgi:hypothetical protein
VSNLTWVPPTYQQFQTTFPFNRAFPFAGPNTPTTDLDYVQTQDYQGALNLAIINFSPEMFDNNGMSTTVFMWLLAFYLAEGLKIASKGIAAQANFSLTAIAAGGVNVAMTPPESFLKNPTYNMFTRNGFGLQYLSLVYPYTIGGGTIALGTTTYS